MNILEHYIEEIQIEEPYIEEWTREFEAAFVRVKVVTNCYGCVETRETVVREDEWVVIKDRGYFMW